MSMKKHGLGVRNNGLKKRPSELSAQDWHQFELSFEDIQPQWHIDHSTAIVGRPVRHGEIERRVVNIVDAYNRVVGLSGGAFRPNTHRSLENYESELTALAEISVDMAGALVN